MDKLIVAQIALLVAFFAENNLEEAPHINDLKKQFDFDINAAMRDKAWQAYQDESNDDESNDEPEAVKFLKPHKVYNTGEIACLKPVIVKNLIKRKIVEKA